MRLIFITILSLTIVFSSRANDNTSCISGSAIDNVLQRTNPDTATEEEGARWAYEDLIKSGILEYGTPRPYLYAANLSLSRFIKRICHDQICDPGDYLGAVMKCQRPRLNGPPEDCIVIAATKDKDLYCILTPIGWDRSQPYNPFEDKP